MDPPNRGRSDDSRPRGAERLGRSKWFGGPPSPEKKMDGEGPGEDGVAAATIFSSPSPPFRVRLLSGDLARPEGNLQAGPGPYGFTSSIFPPRPLALSRLRCGAGLDTNVQITHSIDC